jgi:hypothetical protein
MPESNSLALNTIDKGSRSNYRYGDASFGGDLLLFREQARWQQFWQQHTADIKPPQPLPEIDFTREIIIAALLGFQASDGGDIAIEEATLADDTLQVKILKDESSGMADVISNPFHIVSLPRPKITNFTVEYLKR